MKSRRMRLGLFILIMILFTTISFAGPEKCSPENAKFKKSFSTITHSLLPQNVWRNEKEKELFFGCVEAEEKFVKEVIGENQSIPIFHNVAMTFGPDGTGTILPGNMRDLKIYPLEIEVQPGKEYLIVVSYLGGMSFSSIIPYYSSDAIEWIDSKTEIYSGAWDFHIQKNGTFYYPRYWDSMRFRVKSKYSDGKPVKKAIVRLMAVSAKMEEEALAGFVIFEASHASAKHYLAEPHRDAKGLDKNGQFF
jgi:hypothetical protein